MNDDLNDIDEDARSVHIQSSANLDGKASTDYFNVPNVHPLSVATDEQEDDESVNILNDLDYSRDESTILLLKQIFPDESAENLWQLHLQRCSVVAKQDVHVKKIVKVESQVPPHRSTKDSSEDVIGGFQQGTKKSKNIGNSRVILPRNFLRLPVDEAVMRHINGKWQHISVNHLTKQAILGHERRYGKLTSRSRAYFTKVVPRDATGGLGMTLISDENRSTIGLPLIRVGALSSSDPLGGLACKADIRCNDIMIGIDGVAFAESTLNTGLLRHAVAIRSEERRVGKECRP